ncbi:MAG: lamin tail domain-containing protein, partial [Caldilineaceae bacterium]|nr:lamin tail domain-containing protein [Caldilineaceae bacterium]
NQDGTWFQVRTPARDGGWMAGSVLALNVAAEAIPVAADIPQASAPAPVAQPSGDTPPADTRTGAVDTGGERNADQAPLAAGALRIIAVDKRAEYVIIRNDGGAPVNLRGWTVVSVKGNQTWTVPFDFDLAAGATVTVHALGGTNDGANLYSGFGSNIWNNSDPDPAVLLNPSGEEISRY